MSAKRMILVNIVAIVVLIVAAIVGYYFYYQATNYVKTDDAKIDGQMMTIGAPANGKLTDWSGKVGDKYDKGDTVGKISAPSKKGTTTKDIKMPQKATIVKQSAVKDAMVGSGTKLAQAYDMKHLWVTANIDEDDIDHVKTGKSVDINVKSYKDTTLKGHVKQIGLATKGTFSLLPSSGDDDSDQIPVKISINDYKGLRIVPGMKADVKIDR